MQFQSIGAQGNYAQAGKAAANDTLKSFIAQRNKSPDYGKLAMNAAEIRSAEKQASVKAESAVAQAGIAAGAKVKANQMEIDGEMAYKKGKRMAGVLTVGGQMVAQAGEHYSNADRKLRETGTNDAHYDKQRDRVQGRLDDAKADVDKYTNWSYSDPSTSGTPKASSTTDGGLVATATPAPKLDGGITGKGGGTVSQPNGGSTGMRLMTDLTKNGYTPTQAAAIAGNAQYESANFTAHEEFAPNAYGTKGAGFFQWTNAAGSNRRDNFESYAKANGLDPRSYGANTGFMMHELKGGAGNHWTGGMNDQSFRQISDLNTAVTSFQNNYLRPARETANTAERLKNSQVLLNQWNAANS